MIKDGLDSIHLQIPRKAILFFSKFPQEGTLCSKNQTCKGTQKGEMDTESENCEDEAIATKEIDLGECV
ncbi:conserved hypothetical protein [Ricinus communis]|uniref:Uncharacterized protein n=1 Tax=Ricinus communis TaxID=3988 RepID=B9SS23_RICCO|nr:conserved hypothetical protein [Ricinus communis]